MAQLKRKEDLSVSAPEPTRLRTVPQPRPLERSSAERACISLGLTLIALGLLGFASPGLAGMHLSPLHCVLYLAAGCFSVWTGINSGALVGERRALALGAVWGGVGVLGFLAGMPGFPSVPSFLEDRFLLVLVPGTLEWGMHDHILHLLVGTIYWIAGLTGNDWRAPSDRTSRVSVLSRQMR
jgi:hypothetical protein